MIIGPDYVFVSVPKCGTHTMYHVLQTYFDGVHLEPPYHRKKIPEIHQKKFRFTIIRNPYPRAVSIWMSLTRHVAEKNDWIKAAGGDDLGSFMQLLLTGDLSKMRNLPSIMPIHKWLGGMKFDLKIKLESLERSFAALPFIKGREYEIPHELKRVDDWKNYLKPEITPLIREWAGVDFNDYRGQP